MFPRRLPLRLSLVHTLLTPSSVNEELCFENSCLRCSVVGSIIHPTCSIRVFVTYFDCLEHDRTHVPNISVRDHVGNNAGVMLVALVWTRLRAADMNLINQTSNNRDTEWTKEQTLMLINHSQSHSVLWYPTDPNYKNRLKKVDTSSE